MSDLHDIPDEYLEEVLSDPLVQEYLELQEGFWYRFKPRPDRPADFDQQASFVLNHDPVSFMIGGNAAGTTEASAFKAAQFVLRDQEAPRKDCPFWIISETYEQVCDTCWKEKLLGNGHIPPSEVEWERIRWKNHTLNWPLSVPLKPWKDGDQRKNWMLEFKSYKQGRRTMQARSIGGFWFSEQFPWSLFTEVLRGCRNYMFPGAQFCEFTPVEPELSLQIEKVMESPPAGWQFYRANTALNRPNLAAGWYEQFFGSISEDMRATRETGELAGFEGIIYPAFSRSIHVVDDNFIPPNVWHRRGTDWGASEEHPFTHVWAYYDSVGVWTIYDEYWSTDQTMITADHAEAIRKRWPWPEDDPHFGMNYADPARPGEINEFNVRGIPTGAASNNVFEGIECIRGLLKTQANIGPRLRIHRRCKHLIEEFRKYRWMKAKKAVEGVFLNPQAARPAPLKRDDDTLDALRYCIFSDQKTRGATPDSMRHSNYRQRGGATVIGERSADALRNRLRGRAR